MSGLFGATIIKGTRLTDFGQTTVSVGQPIPFGYGRFRCDGNIIAAKLPPKETRSVKRQGKGGVKTEEFSYDTSYAIAFCEGPIYGYWQITRQGKVVYSQDPNVPVEDKAYAQKWLQKATLHYGTPDQLPDSVLESIRGTGMVSGHHYLAYISLAGDDVTSNGGAVPTYEAVPMATPPEAYLTSHPYPAFIEEFAAVNVVPIGGETRIILHEYSLPSELANVGVEPIGGEMREPLVLYNLPTETASFSVLPTGGILRLPLKDAKAGVSSATYLVLPVSGSMKVSLISASVQPSSATYSIAPTGGTLT